MKQEIANLWKTVFGDTDEFIDLWFSRVYKDEQTLSLSRNGRIVSALQIIPYEMSSYGSILPVGYVCGVCTLPEERGKGCMTQLMRQAEDLMRERGLALAMLIPASQQLFDLYRRFGYLPAFDRVDVSIQADDAAAPLPDVSISLVDSIATSGIFPFYDRIQRTYDMAILHTAEQLETVRLDCVSDGGDCWVAYRDNRPAGMAFAAQMDCKTLFVNEIVANDKAVYNALLQYIMRHYNAASARVRVRPKGESAAPYGMALVLDNKNIPPHINLRTAYMNLMMDGLRCMAAAPDCQQDMP
ncbi:MAG: GNAT family N-acetyltransferase [Tannerella sp.]|jgi:predicted acetyltransferase|nr:GNAT family N-acetyltransferase [Tannerella sp.]